MREKKLRIEDALSATKSASKEGIVIGGGSALLACKKALLRLSMLTSLSSWLRSFEIYVAPVKRAMSSRYSFCFSPKDGAFIATELKLPLMEN